MDPVKTTDTTIAGKNGKNFDDIAYVVDGATYRFRIVYSGDASITPTQQQKDILKRMVSTFQFTK